MYPVTLLDRALPNHVGSDHLENIESKDMVRPKKIDTLETMLTDQADVVTIILLRTITLEEKDCSRMAPSSA
jgi:hypothetical protein